MIVLVPKRTAIVRFKYRPIALTYTVMKYFEKIVLRRIKMMLQFAYRAYRLTDDAINTALHTALNQLECSGCCLNFSSAFNMIILSITGN